MFDVDYFIQKMNGFIKVVKDLPTDTPSKEPFRVDCSKRKGQFDYRETILPLLLEHHYISLTPAMSQRRDRYMFFFVTLLNLVVSYSQHLRGHITGTPNTQKPPSVKLVTQLYASLPPWRRKPSSF